MMNESSIGASAPVESGAPPSAGYTPSPTDTSSAPIEQPAGTASAVDVQGTATTETDPLAGLPSLEELSQMPDDAQYKKSLIQQREAIEKHFKPQLSELTEKYKIFEPVAEKFSAPEQVQEMVELKDALFGFERDHNNRLVPSSKGAEFLQKRYPEQLNYVWADAAEMEIQDPDTGQSITRINLALKSIADNPAQRAEALKLLGGVEPTSIAPTWQPSDEELNAIDDPEYPTTEGKALQEIYRSLPYDERQELRANTPEFIKTQLKKEQALRQMTEQNRIGEERQTRENQRREAYFNQQAESAANQYVESQFKQGFAEFANSVVEGSKFIAPLDATSEVAKTMSPEQLTAANQQIQQINTGVGKMIATVTAALGHPDTKWIAEDFLTSLGVDPSVIQEFDNARTEFARNARDYGELEFRARNGQTQGANGLGNLQSNSTNAMRAMRGRANLVSKPLKELMSKFFEMKAGDYNQTLNGAATARPPLNGTGFNPATAAESRPPRQPSEIWSPQSIERFLPR